MRVKARFHGNIGYTTVVGYLLSLDKRYEKRPPFRQPEQERPQIIVFSGFASLLKNIRGISNEISSLPVDGIVWNSLLSLDRPDPDRYESMAKQILTSLKNQQETHLIAHSFGSAELIRAIMECQKMESQFLERDLSHLHITLVSPSGMFAGIDGFLKFMRNDVPALIESVTLESPYQIVDALMCFPPKDLTQADVSTILQNVFPSHAQINLQKIQPDFAQLPDMRDYSSFLSESDARSLRDIDAKLAGIYKRVKPEVLQYCGVRNILKERTQLLKPYLERLYHGECYEQPNDSCENFDLGLFATAAINFLPALKEKFFGRFPDLLKDVRNHGASLEILIPTHDAFVPFARVAQLFPNEEITFIPGTHMTFPVQPQSVLSAALREHRERR